MKKRVKELRKELGLTLEQFGEKLGVTKQTISRIENGVNNLTDQMFRAICNVNWNGRYVNKEWLKGNSDEMFKPNPTGELEALAEKYNMSNAEYTFLKEYFKLEPSRREQFFEILDMMFSAIHSNTSTTVTASAEPTIDERVEAYRRELELEEKVREESSALQKDA